MPASRHWLSRSLMLCTFTNQVLAELDLLWYWKETTAYKNDLHSFAERDRWVAAVLR